MDVSNEEIRVLVAEIASLLVLVALLWRYVVPPLRRAMQARQDTIRAQFEEAERAKEQYREAEKRHERALTNVRLEASRLLKEAQGYCEQIIEDASDEARRHSNEILERTRDRIANVHDQATRELQHETIGLVLDLAGRIVTESLQDEERQKRMIERFLYRLEQTTTTSDGNSSSSA